jgi:hypothetical protein
MAHDSILLINPTAFHLRICIFFFFATFSSYFLYHYFPSLPLSLSKDLKEEVINEGAMWPFKGG